MIKYSDLVQYIKEEHINWNTELFEVLKGFIQWYMVNQSMTHVQEPDKTDAQGIPNKCALPEGPEYSIDDVLNLFS